MTDSDEIIVLSPDDTDDDDVRDDDFFPEDEADYTEESKKGPFLTIMLVAAGFVAGAALTVGAVWYFQPQPYNPAPLEARIEALQTELTELANRPLPEPPIVDLSPLERRLTALEARPTVDPLNEDIVARMEALQDQGFEVPEIPDFPDFTLIEDRLETLETEMDNRAVEAIAIAEAQARAAQIKETVDPSRLPNFPAQTLRDGAAELAGTGLLRRTLSRHVRIGGKDSPEWLIEQIAVDMRAGKARSALQTFDQLPVELQQLARAWRADMEDIVQ